MRRLNLHYLVGVFALLALVQAWNGNLILAALAAGLAVCLFVLQGRSDRKLERSRTSGED